MLLARLAQGRAASGHATSATLSDALEIRRRLLLAFERAETTDDPALRRRLRTFVLVGGGPTGVELAGSVAELARFALRRDFRRIDPASARVVLVEAEPKLLNGFADRLSAYALRALRRMNVEVRLSTPIEAIDADGVATRDGRIDASLVVWCAGVKGTPAADWLGVAPTPQGTVAVAPDLSVPGHPEVFVVGDLARVAGPDGRPLPQVAPVAKQQAAHVARVIAARVTGREPPPAFAYRDPGALAVIGRSAAVADFGRLKLTGFAGWLVWSLAHIFFLIGFRNRGAVFLAWAWEWLTYKRGARLIAEPPRGPAGPGTRVPDAPIPPAAGAARPTERHPPRATPAMPPPATVSARDRGRPADAPVGPADPPPARAKSRVAPRAAPEATPEQVPSTPIPGAAGGETVRSRHAGGVSTTSTAGLEAPQRGRAVEANRGRSRS